MYAHGLSTRDIEALFADEDGRSLRSSYRAVLDRSSARERGCAALPARGSSQGSTEIAQRLSENEDRLQGL
jgi:hypothetical protein